MELVRVIGFAHASCKVAVAFADVDHVILERRDPVILGT